MRYKPTILALLIAFALCMTPSTIAHADTATIDIGDHEGGTLTIASGESVTVTGTVGSITIVCQDNSTLTLDNVAINGGGIECNGNVHIHLTGENTIVTGETCIAVPSGSSLMLHGPGTLSAQSTWRGTTIGHRYNAGAITIKNATIEAYGTRYYFIGGKVNEGITILDSTIIGSNRDDNEVIGGETTPHITIKRSNIRLYTIDHDYPLGGENCEAVTIEDSQVHLRGHYPLHVKKDTGILNVKNSALILEADALHPDMAHIDGIDDSNYIITKEFPFK